MNANTYLYQYSDFEDCGLYIGDTGKLACSPSKKLKNVYHLLYTNENLCLAQYNAQHGKGERSEINDFNEHICERLDELYEMLAYETYVPGKYKERKIHDDCPILSRPHHSPLRDKRVGRALDASIH